MCSQSACGAYVESRASQNMRRPTQNSENPSFGTACFHLTNCIKTALIALILHNSQHIDAPPAARIEQMERHMKRYILASLVTLGLSVPALADPTVGLGLSFSFGGGTVDTGVGVRVFSGNKRDKAAATLGMDYMFGSKRVRATVGAAYLQTNSYIGVDMGFGFNGEGVDFGLGLGGVKTKKPAAPLKSASTT
jgi:hypothetical protein